MSKKVMSCLATTCGWLIAAISIRDWILKTKQKNSSLVSKILLESFDLKFPELFVIVSGYGFTQNYFIAGYSFCFRPVSDAVLQA